MNVSMYTHNFALLWSNSSSIFRLLKSQTLERKRGLRDAGSTPSLTVSHPFSYVDDWPGEYAFPSVIFNLPPPSDTQVES